MRRLTKLFCSTVSALFVAHVCWAEQYLSIDLSGGPSATNYPVTYFDSVPVGGWTDEYKTTKLVMRKIPTGSFIMGSPTNELGRGSDEVQHLVTLTKSFYVGVFGITQRQWELVMGNRPSWFNNTNYYATRPVEQVNYGDIRGTDSGVSWPANNTVGPLSFMGLLRAKTGLQSLDLPTDAQWEYACRAGTSTALNNGRNLTSTSSCTNLSILGRYYYNGGNNYFQSCSTSLGSAKVGSYLPNAWGLYDMHGNIWQWCLDWYGPFSGAATDPCGVSSGQYRILRGGSFASGARDCRSADRNFVDPSYRFRDVGFRVVTTTTLYQLTISGGRNGGQYGGGTTTVVVADSPAQGQVFAGWRVAPEGADLGAGFDSTQLSTVVTMPAYDVTLSAQYTAEWYTVTFDAGAGNVSTSDISVTNGMAYGELPTASRAGYGFQGWWTLAGGAGSQVTATTVVTSFADHTLYAKWVRSPLLSETPQEGSDSVLGSYDGFCSEQEVGASNTVSSVVGLFSLKVSGASGKLTAKVSLQKATLTFSAARWTSTGSNGVCRAVLSSWNGAVLDICVGSDRVWGTLGGGALGGAMYAVDGARNRFAVTSDVAAQALLNGVKGYYTVSLPVNDVRSCGVADAAPRGCGFITLTVSAGGKVRYSGQLADGAMVSGSSQLIAFDESGAVVCVPLFAPLYARKGWVGGLLWIDVVNKTVVTDRDYGWFIRWEYPGSGPDAFSLELDACGGFYSATQVLASHYLFSAETNDVPYYFKGGAADVRPVFPTDIGVVSDGSRLSMAKGVKPVMVGGLYDYGAAENTSLATLTFMPATGLVKGKFNLYYDYLLGARFVHVAVSVPYAGVFTPVRTEVFAGLAAGQGYYLVPDKDPGLIRYNVKRSYGVEFVAVP